MMPARLNNRSSRRQVWLFPLSRPGGPKTFIFGFALISALMISGGPVIAQGTIVYGTAQSLYYVGDQDLSFDINITGNTSPDFVLISGNAGTTLSSVETAWFGVRGNNQVLCDDGNEVVALTAGTPIGSSLARGVIWYNKNTDAHSQANMGGASDGGATGYFYGGTYYLGFDLNYGGADHYGWMRVSNPTPVLFGQILDWAYETTPNTPIQAGAVPEPSIGALVGCFAMCGWLFSRSSAMKRRELFASR
jgi:hypothetical protein